MRWFQVFAPDVEPGETRVFKHHGDNQGVGWLGPNLSGVEKRRRQELALRKLVHFPGPVTNSILFC